MANILGKEDLLCWRKLREKILRENMLMENMEKENMFWMNCPITYETIYADMGATACIYVYMYSFIYLYFHDLA